MFLNRVPPPLNVRIDILQTRIGKNLHIRGTVISFILALTDHMPASDISSSNSRIMKAVKSSYRPSC